MGTRENRVDEMLIECEVCLKEIPGSEAKTDEVNDYVTYFCGLDCFEKWKNTVKNTSK